MFTEVNLPYALPFTTMVGFTTVTSYNLKIAVNGKLPSCRGIPNICIILPASRVGVLIYY